MDDKDRTAIETEISTEKGIITEAEAIIVADQAKLAASDALGNTGPAVGPVDAFDPNGQPASGDTPTADIVNVCDFGAAGDGITNDAPTINTAVAAAKATPTAEPASAQSLDDPVPQAPVSDLSTDMINAAFGPVTPLPANELGPIIPDTAEAGAGAIIAPQAPTWDYPDQPPSMGRIVRYRAANAGEKPDGNEFHAALITKVNEDWTLSLSVFPEGRNPMFVSFAQFGDVSGLPGTWCWPPRV